VRFVVYGAGGIGGVVGGRLLEHGHEVVLIARGAHLDAMRSGGLQLADPTGEVTLDVQVAGSPAEVGLGTDDVVLLAMKSQDTPAAVDALADAAPPGLPVVCLQNGVENERVVLRRFPHVHAVPVMCPTGHLEPGAVVAYSTPVTGILDVGRYPDGADEVTEAVAQAFSASTFVSEARPDVMRWKWSKLLMNLGNAVEAVCEPGDRSRELLSLLRAEGEASLRAAGVDVASAEEDRERRGNLLRMQPVGGQRRGGGSSWQSLARGTGTIEADWLNGEIVLLGRLHGVASLGGVRCRRSCPPRRRCPSRGGTTSAR
jgi:2-dehydropantoate 2-reductase